MSKDIYIPLRDGAKTPAVTGWASPSYEGVAPEGRVGLRADNYVIVDCDSVEAMRAWVDTVGREAADTYSVKTPRGWHFYYRATPGAPTGPMVGVFPGIDIRAGSGSYVVAPPTEGYNARNIGGDIIAFQPSWLPKREQQQLLDGYEEWDTIPEGRRNNTLTALAGTLRKQGASVQAIAQALAVTNKMYCDPPLDLDELRTIAGSVSRYAPDPDIDIEVDLDDDEEEDPDTWQYLSAKRMELRPPPDFYWEPYLPKGRFVMIDGAEGIGKGMLCALIATYSATGKAFPGQGTPLDPRPVVWYSAEDDPHDDILRRLYAAGYRPGDADTADIRMYNPTWEYPAFPKSIDHLRTVIATVKPRFVILDPGRSYLAPPDGVEANYNSETAMRPGLQRLQALAHETDTTIIFVHHWNKTKDGTTRDKSAGSIVFQQVPRCKVTLQQVGEHRALSLEKSNIRDKAYTVFSYDVVENPEYETGVCKLGTHLREFASLDEWAEITAKLDAEVDHEVFVDIGWEEALHRYDFLADGALAPTSEQIARDLGIDLEEAKKIRMKLRELGFINGGGSKAGRWHPQPPQERPEE